MKTTSLLITLLFLQLGFTANAYEIRGAKPISKLAEEQAKAKQDKKLICIIYKGSNEACPHCENAAANGVKSVSGDALTIYITEKESRDKTIISKLPQPVQAVLKKQSLGAWVSFTVFDADLTTVIASADRHTLDTDRKGTRAFAKKVTEAKKELK
jgi:hypothetical protein